MRYALLMLGFACLLLSGLLGGCAAPTSPTHLDVPSGQYAVTFDAARQALREYRFDLERVDAGLGVISTRPKHSAGFMTLWDSEQSSADQEIEDVMHNQRRVVRVTFEPTGTPPPPPPTAPPPATDAAEPVPSDPAPSEPPAEHSDEPIDLRDAVIPTRMNVRVIVLRDYKPGLQVQTSSVRLSQYTYDTSLATRGMFPDFETAVTEDPALAAHLTKRIGELTGNPVAAAKP